MHSSYEIKMNVSYFTFHFYVLLLLKQWIWHFKPGLFKISMTQAFRAYFVHKLFFLVWFGLLLTSYVFFFSPSTTIVLCIWIFFLVEFSFVWWSWVCLDFLLFILTVFIFLSLCQVQGVRGALGLRAPMPVDMQPHQGLYYYETSPSQPSRG